MGESTDGSPLCHPNKTFSNQRKERQRKGERKRKKKEETCFLPSSATDLDCFEERIPLRPCKPTLTLPGHSACSYQPTQQAWLCTSLGGKDLPFVLWAGPPEAWRASQSKAGQGQTPRPVGLHKAALSDPPTGPFLHTELRNAKNWPSRFL